MMVCCHYVPSLFPSIPTIFLVSSTVCLFECVCYMGNRVAVALEMFRVSVRLAFMLKRILTALLFDQIVHTHIYVKTALKADGIESLLVMELINLWHFFAFFSQCRCCSNKLRYDLTHIQCVRL